MKINENDLDLIVESLNVQVPLVLGAQQSLLPSLESSMAPVFVHPETMARQAIELIGTAKEVAAQSASDPSFTQRLEHVRAQSGALRNQAERCLTVLRSTAQREERQLLCVGASVTWGHDVQARTRVFQAFAETIAAAADLSMAYVAERRPKRK